MSNQRVYSTVIGATVAAGTASTNEFFVNNFNRSFLLKSVFLDVRLFETLAPFAILPFEMNFTQEFGLTINSIPAADLFCSPFQDYTIPANIITNGNSIVMWKPGQIKFDSFFIKNQLQLIYAHANRDMLVSYRFFASIILEIEDIEFK